MSGLANSIWAPFSQQLAQQQQFEQQYHQSRQLHPHQAFHHHQSGNNVFMQESSAGNHLNGQATAHAGALEPDPSAQYQTSSRITQAGHFPPVSHFTSGGNSHSTTKSPVSTTTTAASTVSAPLAPAAEVATANRELERYVMIVRRLKWKAQFLDGGYRQAVALVDPVDQAAVAAKAEAELMFKLDFFEYYMLIERALVHLQGVFGITVWGAGSSLSHNFEPRRGAGNLASSRHYHPHPQSHHGHGHSYHAIVLETLEKPENPLREVLGRGAVRAQLLRAKELRNRWKNADEAGLSVPAASAPPLESYDLSKILTTVFAGFDAGFGVAAAHVAALNGGAGGPGWGGCGGGDDESWAFMTDAMDWEAV